MRQTAVGVIVAVGALVIHGEPSMVVVVGRPTHVSTARMGGVGAP